MAPHDLAAQIRDQLKNGSVWYDRDSVHPHDGLQVAMQAADADRPAFSAALFPLLADDDLRLRTGAVALLREILPYVGADAAATVLRDKEPLFRGVAPAWRIERDDLEQAAALAIGPGTKRGNTVASLWLATLALHRPWGWVVLGDLARIDPDWVLTRARSLVKHEHLGVILALPADRRLELIDALQPYPPETPTPLTRSFWARFPPEEAKLLRSRMWPPR